MPHRRGGEGIDFNANLNISTIDFGTFHVRPPPPPFPRAFSN